VVQSLQASAVSIQKRLRVAEQLPRLGFVVADVSALAHHRVDQVVPARGEEGIRREETVALEGVVGAQGDGLADPLTEKLAGEKPAKVGRVTAFGEVDAQLLGVEAAARKQAEKLLV